MLLSDSGVKIQVSEALPERAHGYFVRSGTMIDAPGAFDAACCFASVQP
jgi:hypothetical protein